MTQPIAPVRLIIAGLTLAKSHVPVGNFEAIAKGVPGTGGQVLFDVPFIDIFVLGRQAWPLRWILRGLDQCARVNTSSLVIPCGRIG